MVAVKLFRTISTTACLIRFDYDTIIEEIMLHGFSPSVSPAMDAAAQSPQLHSCVTANLNSSLCSIF